MLMQGVTGICRPSKQDWMAYDVQLSLSGSLLLDFLKSWSIETILTSAKECVIVLDYSIFFAWKK